MQSVVRSIARTRAVWRHACRRGVLGDVIVAIREYERMAFFRRPAHMYRQWMRKTPLKWPSVNLRVFVLFLFNFGSYAYHTSVSYVGVCPMAIGWLSPAPGMQLSCQLLPRPRFVLFLVFILSADSSQDGPQHLHTSK
jgi:hypothetical protein